MSAEDENVETLQYKYVYSFEDDKKAFAKHDTSIKAKLHLSLISLSILIILQFYILYLIIKLSLPLSEIISIIIFCIFIILIRIILVLRNIANYKNTREYFDPLEIRTWVDNLGVYNKTPYANQYFNWALVKNVKVMDYGLVFQTTSSHWFVPRSAFNSHIEMHKELKKIQAIWKKSK